MHRNLLLLVDVAIFAAAGVLAWFLRVGLEAGEEDFGLFVPYEMVSLAVVLVVLRIFRIHLHFFRYFSLYELARMAAAIALAISLTVLISFGLFRMDNVYRSIPFLHWGFAIGGFALLRVIGLLAGLRRESRHRSTNGKDRVAVLLIGYTPAAGLFLQSVPVFGDRRWLVAGILDENPRHLGQRLRQCEVIGHPRGLEQTQAQMSIHGVEVRRIVLCIDKGQLSAETCREIERLERDGRIEVHDFVGHTRAFLNFAPDLPIKSIPRRDDRISLPAELRAKAEMAVARYGALKRGLDIVLALLIGAALIPVMVFVLPAIRLTMGAPVIFWQERPGRHGKVFRLYKLRTLSDGVDAQGRVLDDADRQTFVGRLLRRTRLDEIPQLLNVLAGDMSFVGPRPLLPVDLPPDLPGWSELRAMVRPGLTGWAQVNGGQEVSKEDKVVMDAWYIANMSPWQDIRVILLTLKTVLNGEKLDRVNITQTYQRLNVPAPQLVTLAEWRKQA